MSDGSPKYGGIAGAGVLGSSSTTGQALKVPEVEVPEVGDTVRIVAGLYNHHIYVEGQEVRPGSKIIELEVKAIKGVKVTFE